MSLRPFHKLPGSSSLSGVVVAKGSSSAVALKVNLTAITNPGVNNDSSSGYSVGSMWINTIGQSAWFCADASVGAAVWGRTGTQDAIAVVSTITITNTFSSGNVIRKTSTNYALAQADSESDARVIGVVESASGSAFTVIYSGACTVTAHGFTVGATLFLSPSSAGLLTTTEPTTRAQVSKPVAVVLDANTLLIFNQRGILVPPQNTGYTATATTGGTVSLAPATSADIQDVSGTLATALIINQLRTSAYAGQKQRIKLTITCDAVNTLTIQENSAGALKFWPNFSGGSTVTGVVELVYTGSAWIVLSDQTNEVET